MRRGPEEGDRPSGWNVGGVARPHLTPGRDRDDGTVMQGGEGGTRERRRRLTRANSLESPPPGGAAILAGCCVCISGIEVNTLFLAPEGPSMRFPGEGREESCRRTNGERCSGGWATTPHAEMGRGRKSGQAGHGPWTVAESGWRCVCGTSHAVGVLSLSACAWASAKANRHLREWNACLLVGVVVVDRWVRGLAIGGRRGNGRGSGAVEGCRRRKTRSGKHGLVKSPSSELR